jgi:bisphosphoglycerate-independent phosphoglycerate mutase (AlkP superfamily)
MKTKSLGGMIAVSNSDVFSVDILQDAAGRYYVYQRHNRQRRISMSYPTMDALQEVLVSNEVQWLEWQDIT